MAAQQNYPRTAMLIRRLLQRFVLMNAIEEGGGGGTPAPVIDAGPSAAEPQGDASPVATDAAAAPAAPKTMLEAMFPEKPDAAAAPGQPRDQSGRFAPKAGDDAAPGTAPAAAAPVVPAAKPGEPKPDADLAMPEGLGAKGQERFQALANEVKELRPLRERVDLAERQVEYVKQQFHDHGVKPEQFEQATAVIGMLNRGDYAGAQKVLTQQLQQIALITGQPVAPVDALEQHPDLRAAVDGMQITEQHALELARGRQQQAAVQQHQQRQQAQQSSEQAVDAGMLAVDKFCKRMQGSDLDYGVVEAQLLPEIPNLIKGVPPQQWPGLIETQYRLIKNTAAKFRQSVGSTAPSNPLRANGAGSPATAPKSMHEAMWGQPAPRA